MTPPPPPPIYKGPDLRILKVDHLLPRHPDKSYSIRPISRIARAILHHSAGPCIDGVAGPAATARGHVARNWPGIGYHYFLPYRCPGPGDLPAVYLTQSLRNWAYHTGKGWNGPGIGIVAQGCFASRHDAAQGPISNQPTPGPSDHQLQALAALWGYLVDRFPGIEIYGHFDAGKQTCPGDDLEFWVRGVRGEPAINVCS